MKSNLTAELICWIVLGIIVIAAIYFSAWLISLFAIFLATIFYVYRYFWHEGSRASSLFFYFGIILISILCFAGIYGDKEIIDTASGKKADTFLDHIYFSIVTWTTLGYGDFRPSEEARIFAALQAFLGYLYMAIFVAKLLHWLNTAEKPLNDT